ncbi:MAG: hypothetical protein MJZ26_15020 [Fibrobacter sp.]|nr:hypothetical protein [Fibrobacter sp.]
MEKLKDERPGAVPGENQNQKIGPNKVGKKVEQTGFWVLPNQKKDFKHV